MRSLLLSIKGFIETTESPIDKNLRTNDSLSTYRPLVGILTATDPSSITICYDYGSFNRLKRTYIKEGTTEKNIRTYDYHYQNQ